MGIILDERHNLRSGWKFSIYTVVFLTLWVATALLLSMFFIAEPVPEVSMEILGLNAIALFVPAIAAMIFMARFVDHVPIITFGAGRHRRWTRDTLLGIGIAAGLIVTLFAGALVVGSVDTDWTGGEHSPGILVLVVAILLVSAANEELVFRGYPLQVLMRGLGVWPAVLIMSGIFGLLHAFNPNSSLLGTFNTVIAGVMLSLAYLKTRSLWFPYGIHVGWNVGLSVVSGYPLSGLDIPSLWTTRVQGPELVLGGNYGPEGGLLGTLIFCAGAVAARAIRSTGISPELQDALRAADHQLTGDRKS